MLARIPRSPMNRHSLRTTKSWRNGVSMNPSWFRSLMRRPNSPCVISTVVHRRETSCRLTWLNSMRPEPPKNRFKWKGSAVSALRWATLIWPVKLS